MTALRATKRIAVPTIDAVARCTEFAAAQAREAGFSLSRVHEIELVVEEVVANICRYSYGDRIGSVELTCRQSDGPEMVMEFIDYGAPYDLVGAPLPDLSLDLDQRDVGGMGVPMLRALVDDASYRSEGARNVLSLIIHPAPKLGVSTDDI
jgi:anti-sigma regulatory factor (Ser/Thr protein kinase)